MKNKTQIVTFIVLFFLSILPCYSQTTSGLDLNFSKKKSNKWIIQCELNNISDQDIGTYFFLTLGNTLYVEDPNGVIDFIGGIICGKNIKSEKVAAKTSREWSVNIYEQYFDTHGIIRPKQDGTYKFYWVVNGVESDPIFYEYTRDK